MGDWLSHDPASSWQPNEMKPPYSRLPARVVIGLEAHFDPEVADIQRRYLKDRGYIIVDNVKHV